MAKLTSNLSRIAAQAPMAARAALAETAADIVDLTKQFAPVRTGALRKSYTAEPIAENAVAIGSDVPYAPFQEYGTSRMSAQPHLTPAFHQSEPTFRARLAEEMVKMGQEG